MNKVKGTAIKGFPNYFVVGEDIWKVTPEEERIMVPSASGKIALKNDRGVPIPMMHKDIIDKVKEAAAQLRITDETLVIYGDGRVMARGELPLELKANILDPELVKERDRLKAIVDNLFATAKATTDWATFQSYRIPYYAAKKELDEFYEEFPEYNPERKKAKVTNWQPPRTEDELEWEKKWNESCKDVEDAKQVLFYLKIEIEAKYGKKNGII